MVHGIGLTNKHKIAYTVVTLTNDNKQPFIHKITNTSVQLPLEKTRRKISSKLLCESKDLKITRMHGWT